MHEGVGKTGIHAPPLAPARILRPGDPGFPVDAGQSVIPTRTEPMSEKPCRFDGCSKAVKAGKYQRYCTEHADPANRKPLKKPRPGKAAAEAIASLRVKEALRRTAPASAFDTQVGGDHYQSMPIQPVEFIAKNKLSFCAGNVVKYLCRHTLKGGAEDLDKAIHYLQLERETLYGKV